MTASTIRQQSVTLSAYDGSTRDLEYDVLSGTVTFNELVSPYLQANLVCMIPVGPNTPAPTPIGSAVPNLITNYLIDQAPDPVTTGWTASYTGTSGTIQFTINVDPDNPDDPTDTGFGMVLKLTAGTGVTKLILSTTIATTIGATYTALSPAYAVRAAVGNYDFDVIAGGVALTPNEDSTFVATTTSTVIQYVASSTFEANDFLQIFGPVGVFQADWNNPSEGQPANPGTYFWSIPIDPEHPYSPPAPSAYATAQLYFQGLPDLSKQVIDTQALAAMDPRNKNQVGMQCTLYEFASDTGDLTDQTSVSSIFNVEACQVDYVAGTMTVLLATDEFILQKEGNTTASPTNYRAQQASLIAVVNQVLTDSGIDNQLDASSEDADVTTTSELTNLFTNPNSVTTPWIGASGTTVTINTGAGASAGTQRCVATTAASTAATVYLGGMSGTTSDAVGVTPGEAILALCYVSPVGAARNAEVIIRFFNASGATIANTTAGYVACPVSAWTRVQTSVTVPANAVSALAYVSIAGSSASTVAYISAAMLVIGSETGGFETDGVTPLNFFSGASAANSYYTYAWNGGVNSSTSNRQPQPTHQATVDSLTLSPGISYWDMLQPIVSNAGLRLFCDENNTWFLVNATTYSLPGTITVTPTNATALSETVDMTSSDYVVGSVVVKYTWINAQGNTETSYDAAGTEGPIRLVELDNTPYPGPGRAATLLAQAQARENNPVVTAMTDFSARPYMADSITAPYTDAKTGIISSVSFDVMQAEMSIASRDVIS